jgi:hypothetical protein
VARGRPPARRKSATQSEEKVPPWHHQVLDHLGSMVELQEGVQVVGGDPDVCPLADTGDPCPARNVSAARNWRELSDGARTRDHSVKSRTIYQLIYAGWESEEEGCEFCL